MSLEPGQLAECLETRWIELRPLAFEAHFNIFSKHWPCRDSSRLAEQYSPTQTPPSVADARDANQMVIPKAVGCELAEANARLG